MEVTLLSGGIDSLVCAEDARERGELAGCVFVDYGHPAQQAEGWKAFAYCGERGVPLKVVHVFGADLGDMGLQAGARVVPMRNAWLLALAANVAGSFTSDPTLVIGCNLEDQRNYRDCRPGFLAGLAQVLGMRIAAPLRQKSKEEIIARARELGLSRRDAWSCYLGGANPCGTCPSCLESERAWTA